MTEAAARLEGAYNFREVSGQVTDDGRVVRRGRLFRSDTLQFLSAGDVGIVRDRLGIRTIIDLRLPLEVEEEGRGPLEAESDIAYHHLPLLVAGSEQEGSAVPLLDPDNPMVPHYLGYLTTTPGAVARVVALVADEASLPVVIHCTAGKDRTGVAVGLVLSAIGVADEDVAAEYAAGTEELRRVFQRLQTMATYGEQVRSMPPASHLATVDYMSAFLAEVRARYGSTRELLLGLGVTQAQLADLRAGLTEPA